MAGDIAQQIAAPYAEAMLSIATNQNLVDEFGDSARGILAVMETLPGLQDFLASPLVTADRKKALLQEAFASSLHPLMLNLLNMLADRRRILFLKQVCERYLALQRKLQKVALAEVISAKELSDAQREAVIERVKQMTQSVGVELKIKVDPDLIGGVIVRVGSQVIDASLRGQLRRLSLQLA
jgi:F-type H+-transporting ATPase subunit delta